MTSGARLDRPRDDARDIALHVLSRVETGAYANPLLDSLLRQAEISAVDRALATNLTHGTLRWRGRLDYVLSHFARRPLEELPPAIRNILRLGAFQLLLLDRIPASAAVDSSVELAKRHGHVGTAALVNAVLRRVAEGGAALPFPDPGADPVGHLAAAYSHPAWLVARWLARFGFAETRDLCETNNAPPPVALRPNRLLASREVIAADLARDGIRTRPSAYAPDGLVVEAGERPADRESFRLGAFSVQSESSMVVSYLAGPSPGQRVAEVCSGLGGKTTHLAELMDDRGHILAVDAHKAKLARLRENCQRLNITIVHTQPADARRLPPSADFSVALADVPCSGTGVLARRPDLRWHRRPDSVTALNELQGELLAAAAGLLQPGGRVVYSTCSLEPEENEDVVARFLAAHSEFCALDLRAEVNLPSDAYAADGRSILLRPHRHHTDGMFMAKLRREIPQ